jgi:dTDP-4-amino-4,6-dideoxygalactose transaminase
MVPLFDVKSQHQAVEAELRAAFERVLRSGQFILGPEVEGLEKAAANLLGTRHAVGVSSGTDAILLALMALGIGPGDEVICPAFTFFATAGCIARVGATPVFADSCSVCFNIDPADAGRRITAKTRAIIPVHLFGQTAEMDGIMSLARKHDLAVIEDAAQSIGAEYRGQKAGSIGTFGAFSFFPTKNLGACGDAGLLTTNDDSLAERARSLRTHGARQKYYHDLVGANFRLDALQAAFLSAKLPHLAQYAARRRDNAAFYTDQFSKLPGVLTPCPTDCCQGCAQSTGRPTNSDGPSPEGQSVRLVLPVACPHNLHVWNQFTLRVPGADRRDGLRQFLAARGIGSEVYYPLPLHKQRCFARTDHPYGALPIAEKTASECLSIPIFPELTREQLCEVAAGIGSFLGS